MNPLIESLLDPAAYPHPAPAPRLIETHISWVILAGDYAYKLKKPVNLGFLDFSTLEKREHCCHEEVRLNSRLAPDIYLGVVPVAGTPPKVEGEGQVLEWAVKMRAFPADATLDREADITAEQIDAIANRVAAFHGEVALAPEDSGFGSQEAIQAPVAENFRQLRALLPSPDALLDPLETWTLVEGSRLASHFAARRASQCSAGFQPAVFANTADREAGATFIRECHGDLHLGNIAWVDGALLSPQGGRRPQGIPSRWDIIRKPLEAATTPLIFDGIEFNPGLRFIDVTSEIAFLCMDLMHRGRESLAWRFLNRYLEHTGDYAGLAALPYYLVYRALVRAKVTAIRASQSDGDFAETLSYLALAQRITQRPAAALLLMHGVSGSGKTWVSQTLLEHLPAIRLRSDVERKRLFGLSALADSRAAGADIYSREAGARTLARLLDLTKTLLSAGFRVIVDATFIKRDWREPFQKLAEERGIPWWIAALEAPSEVLRQRVAARQASGHDASEAGPEVLAAQLAAVEPFNADELPHVVPLSGTPLQAVSQIQVLLP